MILSSNFLFLFIFLYFKQRLVDCFVCNYTSHPSVNTLNLLNFNPENRKKTFKYTTEQIHTDHKNGFIHLKALDAHKSGLFKLTNHSFSDKPESSYTHHESQKNIVHYNTFKDVLVSNSGTLIMVMIYLIKIYRLLLFARFLMDSLTNINPFLPPFCFIYETTNFYTKLVEAFPTFMGINIFSEIPWFILNNIDTYLTSLITPIN